MQACSRHRGSVRCRCSKRTSVWLAGCSRRTTWRKSKWTVRAFFYLRTFSLAGPVLPLGSLARPCSQCSAVCLSSVHVPSPRRARARLHACVHMCAQRSCIVPPIAGYSGSLLRHATDLANRLLPAFNTPTGIPFGTINLRFGVPQDESTEASVAGAGTIG